MRFVKNHMLGGSSKKWRCPKCYNWNFMDRKKCWGFNCDEWRPRDLAPKRRLEETNHQSDTTNTWKCPKCYGTNQVDRKECSTSGCDEWRPRNLAPKRKGDWHCCGETQFASNSSCRNCKRPRRGLESSTKKLKDSDHQSVIPNTPELTIFRPGDWMCPKCNGHQFANRTRCRDCDTSRPIKEDKDGNDIGNPCAVCLEKERNAGFLHGKDAHFVCCWECAEKMKKCPMCRKDIDSIIKIF